MKIRILLTVIILAIINSCYHSNKNTEQNKQTRLFAGYLKNNFGTEIPESKHSYLVIPVGNDCPLCINTLLDIIKNNRTNDSITIIVADNANIVTKHYSWLGEKKNILIDKRSEITRYEFGAYGITLVQTNRQKTDTVIHIKPENYSGIFKNH